MAILDISAELIGKCIINHNIKGSCLQLARQDIRLTVEDLKKLLGKLERELSHGYELIADARIQLQTAIAADKAIADTSLLYCD